MNKRVTIRDVAAQAGVSPTAVSLVLNGRPARVSGRTRAAIVDAARRLGYVPNQHARSLAMRRTMLLALIVPDIENLFFASLAKRLEDSCKEYGYALIVANNDDSRVAEHRLIHRLASRGVDGMFVIAAGDSCAVPDPLHADIDGCPCPVVLIDRLIYSGWCDAVGFDNRFGGRLAARFLLGLGHRRLACVSGDLRIADALGRLEGFVHMVDDAPLETAPVVVVEGDYRFSGGYRAAGRIIDSGVTGVFCCNDMMAMGLVQGLHEQGLSVPEDYSVLGYDGIVERFGFTSTVTTVMQRVGWLAHEACMMMMDRIAGKGPGAPRIVTLPPELVRHGTVKALGGDLVR